MSGHIKKKRYANVNKRFVLGEKSAVHIRIESNAKIKLDGGSFGKARSGNSKRSLSAVANEKIFAKSKSDTRSLRINAKLKTTNSHSNNRHIYDRGGKSGRSYRGGRRAAIRNLSVVRARDKEVVKNRIEASLNGVGRNDIGSLSGSQNSVCASFKLRI